MKEFKFKKTREFVQEIYEAWNCNYGTFRYYECTLGRGKREDLSDGFRLELATGGWSENELIIEELKSSIFWGLYWLKSARGSLYIFYSEK